MLSGTVAVLQIKILLSFHYISANDKHHDLLDFFISDSYLKMIFIEFGIFKKLFTVLEVSLFKVLHFCH